MSFASHLSNSHPPWLNLVLRFRVLLLPHDHHQAGFSFLNKISCTGVGNVYFELIEFQAKIFPQFVRFS